MKNKITLDQTALLFGLCTVLLVFGNTVSIAQTFRIDSTFGTNGRKLLQQATGNSGFYDVKKQPDGKIISAGYSNNFTLDALLTRRNTDGTADNTFGNAGDVTLDLGGGEYINSIAIQTDGKIIGCGVKTTTTSRCMIFRLDPIGTADISFGNNGIVDFVNINGTNTTNATLRNLKIQTDGMIVVGGYAYFTNEYRGVVQRYKTNGTLDSSFGNNGTAIIKYVNGSHNYVEDIHIQNDGKILVLGSSYFSADKTHITRLTANGSVDNGFGNAGITTPLFSGFTSNYPSWLATLPDDRIMIIGNAYNSTQQRVITTRLNTAGLVETSYGTNGFAHYQGGPQNNYGYDGHIGTNNDLAIALEYYTAGVGKAGIIKVDSSGSLVNTYGNAGVASFVTLDDGWASSLVSDGDSMYLAGAMKSNTESAYKGYTLKANQAGVTTQSFGLSASAMGMSVSQTARLHALANGDLLATGTNSNMTKDQFIAKLNANGSPATSFGTNGLATLDASSYELVKDAIVLPNQDILLLSETGRRTLTFTSLGTFTAQDKYTISIIGANGQQVGTTHDFSIDANKFPYATQVLRDNNGKYIVLGRSSEAVAYTRYLSRHNANFSLDQSYGTNGRISMNGNTTSVFGDYGSIVIAPDNDVVVSRGEIVSTLGNPFTQVFIKKYKDNGNLDQTFGSLGQYELDDTVGGGLQAYGKLYKGKQGYFLAYIKTNDLKIRAITFGGSVGTFGTVNLGQYRLAGFHQLPDSSLLIACQKDSLCRVVHVLSNGSIDATFNQTGAIEATPFTTKNTIRDWQVMPDTSMVFYHQFEDSNDPTYVGISKISFKNGIVTSVSILNDTRIRHNTYPNPFVEGFYVKIEDGNLNASSFNYQLFDQSGRSHPIMVRPIAEDQVHIDSKINLPPGNYILTAINPDGKSFSSRIIKK